MVSTRKPAKGGSTEHRRRISEGLKEHYRKKPKKRGWLARRIASHFHPDNIKHRKVINDKAYKSARKQARKIEGDLYEAVQVKKLSPEKIAAIKSALAKARSQEDDAINNARKKHRD